MWCFCFIVICRYLVFCMFQFPISPAAPPEVPVAPPAAAVLSPEKRLEVQKVQQKLVLLLHAHKCQRKEQTNGISVVCPVAGCSSMKVLLKHMTECQEGKSCKGLHLLCIEMTCHLTVCLYFCWAFSATTRGNCRRGLEEMPVSACWHSLTKGFAWQDKGLLPNYNRTGLSLTSRANGRLCLTASSN